MQQLKSTYQVCFPDPCEIPPSWPCFPISSSHTQMCGSSFYKCQTLTMVKVLLINLEWIFAPKKIPLPNQQDIEIQRLPYMD